MSTTAADVLSYTFSLPAGDRLVALWQTVDIQDEDPAVAVMIRIPGSGDATARIIDGLAGFQQELKVSMAGSDLVIKDLRIRDYPLFVRLSPVRQRFLPLVIR